MNKELLAEYFKEEEILTALTKIRTKYSHHISDSNFFDIFFELANFLDIIMTLSIETTVDEVGIGKRIVEKYYIKIDDRNVTYTYQFDKKEFRKQLENFNIEQKEMGMMESSIKLTEIFLSLLGEKE